MKIKLFLLAVILTAFPTFGFAQSVVITPKKTVYTRKIRGIDKWKRTFEVRYPILSGAVSPVIKRNLDNTLSYWRVFEISLKESLTEDTWLSSLDYKVNYNKNGILDISLILEGVGAYTSTQTANLVIDLKTGKPVTFDEVFANDSRAGLSALVDKKLAAEKIEIIKSIAADKDSYSDNEARETDKQMINDLKFTAENFNEFSVNDKGVTILYDAGFPHVIQALQPEGRYFFTWTAVKPFIKRSGLLGKFVR